MPVSAPADVHAAYINEAEKMDGSAKEKRVFWSCVGGAGSSTRNNFDVQHVKDERLID